MPRRKKYKRTRGLFKMPSDKPPRPAPEAVYEANEICLECHRPLSNRQIKSGIRCCSYKCSNRRKARLLFKGKPKKSHNRVVSKPFKPHRLAEMGLNNGVV